MDLVSIIVPIYNSNKYIKRCIDSIINQKYKNIEILLIDDGSTDNSLELCNEYKGKDSRVSIISRKNMGVSFTRNEGIEKARGNYILFVDADDFLNYDCISFLMENNENYDVISFNYNIFSDNQTSKGINDFISNGFKYDLNSKNGIKGYVWNKLYKKDIIGKIRFDCSIKICEDLLFNYEICFSTENILYKYFDKPLYNYYLNNESVSNTNFYKDLTKFNAYEKIINLFEKKDIDISNQKKIDYILAINDYRFFNKKNIDFEKVKIIKNISKNYCKELRKTNNLFVILKIFCSNYLNFIYFYVRKVKINRMKGRRSK